MPQNDRIAVIGLACRFPASPDQEAFWALLRDGKSGIAMVPSDRWSVESLYEPAYAPGKSISKWGGFIAGIDLFDAAYFGLSDEQALQLDPLARIFLETSVIALQDAGYTKSECEEKSIGVFVGSRQFAYPERLRAGASPRNSLSDQFQIARAVSRHLSLRGPALVVDSACSSSLLAIHLACEQLRDKTCSIAVAGGVDLLIDETNYVMLSEAKALSPDGICHCFDVKANGFVPGEGSGVVILRALSDALRDGDRVLAIIEGSAVNNDGHTMGITTPNPTAQSEVVTAALQQAKRSASELSYIEAHGTGTMIGDPIELKALKDVFEKDTAERQFCAVGSVKTNVGHLLSAAGVAGLIKVVLALRHRLIPPTLNCETPNPRFQFGESPFYPAVALSPWPTRGGSRVAGVSSFGFGGTNVHIVLTELDEQTARNHAVLRQPIAPPKFKRRRYWPGIEPATAAITPFVEPAARVNAKEPVEQFLVALIRKAIGQPDVPISVEQGFYDLGLDSSQLLAMVQQLEKNYQIRLYPTLLFEYNTIGALAGYLIGSHPEAFRTAKLTGADSEPGSIQANPVQTVAGSGSAVRHGIAIIGIAGKYPQAKNIDEFWTHLANGDDSITVIPSERWDWRQYFDPKPGTVGKSYSKWGGFIADADQFDPLHFNISPHEAERMDPQERIFLQTAIDALGNAGYSRRDFVRQSAKNNLGVFVGVMWNDYHLLGPTDPNREWADSWISLIANRVSFVLDAHGPSIAVDTACSSSLLAVQMACESLSSGRCSMAIAGGVNLSLHPSKYIKLSQRRMLAPDGRCRSFGAGASGYVPGEGVGAVVLKPLDAALRDHDYIYAVIKGGAINHSGKTGGFTVPDPAAQESLIRAAIRDAQVEPETVSFVEAHGTGTALGDPIEVDALTRVFRKGARPGARLAVSSVKSNIGHLEGAAGIAALTKVILQMTHGQLVPSLHSTSLNPVIPFEESGIHVPQTLEKWTSEGPRRAGISSFGAGGTNVHVIVESYSDLALRRSLANTGFTRDHLFTFSANSKELLFKYLAAVLAFCKRPEAAERISILPDMAYTLQTGRENASQRCAIVAATLDQLIESLESLIRGRQIGARVFQGAADSAGYAVSQSASFSEIARWLKVSDLQSLAKEWVAGAEIDFERLYSELPYRMPLPNVPFAEERYWFSQLDNPTAVSEQPQYPLIDELVATPTSRQFTKAFYSHDWLIADHAISGRRVLPAAATVEMCFEAAQSIGSQRSFRLTDVRWQRPLYLDGFSRKVVLQFESDESGSHFKVQTTAEESDVEVLASGRIEPFDAVVPDRRRDLADLRGRLIHEKGQSDFYRDIRRRSIEYGQHFRTVQRIQHDNQRESLAELMVSGSASEYLMHPALLDGAFHSVSVLLDPLSNAGAVYMPVRTAAIELYKPLPGVCFAHATLQSNERDEEAVFDISICSDQGEVLAQINGFAVRRIGEAKTRTGISVFTAAWQKQPPKNDLPSPAQLTFIFEPQFCSASDRRLVDFVGNTAGRSNSANFPLLRGPYEAGDLREAIENVRTGDDSGLVYLLNNSGSPDESDSVLRTILQLTKATLNAKLLRPIPVIIFARSHHPFNPAVSALSGWIRSVRMENPNVQFKLLECLTNENDEGSESPLETIQLIATECRDRSPHVRYINKDRLVKQINASVDRDGPSQPSLIRDKSVLWITGGMGGLGWCTAAHLSGHDVTLILTGRSPLNEEGRQKLRSLESRGSRVHYLQSDVSSSADCRRVLEWVKQKYQRLNGIIHNAGVVKDGFALTKALGEVREVVAAKVQGTIQLDEITRSEQLDFFLLYSSLSSVTGNIGQADYTYANAFLDDFCEHRNRLQAAGLRQGKTIVINWPYWLEGGMTIDDRKLAWLKQHMGIEPMETALGLKTLDRILAGSEAQSLVVCGDEDRFVSYVRDQGDDIRPVRAPRGNHNLDSSAYALAESWVKSCMSVEIKLPESKITPTRAFAEYGIDSVRALAMTAQMESRLGPLSKTLFFEHKTLRELAGFIATTYPEKFVGGPIQTSHEDVGLKGSIRSKSGQSDVVSEPVKNSSDGLSSEGIAIIGLSGRYPKANTLDEFWNNLKNGVDCISEIPIQRWASSEFQVAHFQDSAQPVSRWGGFVDGIDEFDPLFFNIAPHTASGMDPQERLFLETAWKTAEDAGYTRERIRRATGGRVGVFVGVMYGEYQLFGAQKSSKDDRFALSSSYASIANRVSYCLDVMGPSLAVDTMCSSSLTAIHLAIDSIRRGESKMAIAGGVNLSVHPNKYVLLAQGQYTSRDGKCRSFGDNGSGYVPGEGVGAVLLKPLADAVADGDHIYGVIEGSSINHGGRTNGYTVPNPEAQGNVVLETLRKAGIRASQVSYVEAHGTGTSLGDPIEITGLMRAFRDAAGHDCAIGSVKSNIGHLESAAGIAGLTKVLLQIQKRQLVPSLHSDRLNPHINFQETPFHVQQSLADWSPTFNIQSGTNEPRIAAISSFGAGGSNAHLIVREYLQAEKTSAVAQNGHCLFPLSARSMEQLTEYAERILRHLDQFDTSEFQNLVRTFQIGREEMPFRLAAVCRDPVELSRMLEGFLAGGDLPYGLVTGHVSSAAGSAAPFPTSASARDGRPHQSQVWLDLANAWVRGASVNWSQFSGSGDIHVVSAPTYPFQRKRYWYDTHHQEPAASTVQADAGPESEEAGEFATSLNSGVHDNLLSTLRTLVSGILFVSEEELDPEVPLVDFGLDSVLGVELVARINKAFKTDMKAVRLYDHSTLGRLAQHIESLITIAAPAKRSSVSRSVCVREDSSVIAEVERAQPVIASPVHDEDRAVAVIGMAGRFPGAKNAEEFWKNLSEGVDSVQEVPPQRWDWREHYDKNPAAKNKTACKWGGFIQDEDKFDAAFFGITPRDAERMDPQQRVFLEVCWHALEDAGYATDNVSNLNCGVYAGAAQSDYKQRMVAAGVCPDAQMLLGNSQAILSARISYFLNLKGPALAIDTACSSSLVAIHEACQVLRSGRADLMLAGGVCVLTTPEIHIMSDKAGMLSSTGRCKTFDASADGFVPGEGAGVVVLKRLKDALADHDHIYGVIYGSALNQDGKTNGITAPSVESQSVLERRVYQESGIPASEITLVEAHGTGTKLGDPIEMEALTTVFKESTDEKLFCAVGSVKTNIGHALMAAGVASFVKVMLCLKEHKIPPSLHFNEPNEHLHLEGGPFYVNTQLKQWAVRPEQQRFAAISSLGYSGTNCHLVVGEAPAPATRAARKYPAYVLPLSAQSTEALKELLSIYSTWLSDPDTEVELADLTQMLFRFRKHFSHRVAFVVSNHQELILALNHSSPDIRIFDKSNIDPELQHEGNELIRQLAGISASVEYRNRCQTIKELFLKGYSLNWDGLTPGHVTQKLSLPGYPFSRTRYWFDSYADHSHDPQQPIAEIAQSQSIKPLKLRTSTTEQKVSTTVPLGKLRLREVAKPMRPVVAESVLPAKDVSSERIEEGVVMKDRLRRILASVLHVPVTDIGDTRGFIDLGLDSILAIEMIGELNKEMGLSLQTILLFDYPSIEKLAAYLTSEYGGVKEPPPGLTTDVPSASEVDSAATESSYTYDPNSDHAVCLTKPGLVEQIALQNVTSAEPLADEVRIQVRAASLNLGDLLCIKGLYPTQPPYPFSPGFEVSGDIIQVGAGVRDFKVGDAVFALTGKQLGGHACAVNVPSAGVMRKPMSVSYEEAAAFPIVFMTMQYAFEKARPTSGETILIQSAAGGTGLVAVQLAQKLGLTIIATAGSARKLEYLRSIGVRHLINYVEEDLAQAVLQITFGKGVDIVINSLAGAPMQKALDVLGAGGRFVEIAMTGIRNATALDFSRMNNNQEYFSIDLRKLLLDQPKKLAPYLTKIKTALEDRSIKVTIGRAFEFKDVRSAYEYLDQRNNIGKVVLRMPASVPAYPPTKIADRPVKLEGIAIVGQAGRFPGASSVADFWTNLERGVNSITEVPPSRWRNDDVYDPDPAKDNKTYCKWGGFMDQVDQFDPLFFNISGKEAEMMDPQQRLFLEEAWHALEDAGYSDRVLSGKKCGVYVGVLGGDYQQCMEQEGVAREAAAFMGNATSILASRISYFLNLKGPSLAVDTACSSSLVAMHLAASALRDHEIDVAIAGGVSVYSTPVFHIYASKSGMLSPDGQCKTFDESADGFVPGEGVGVVVLKRLADAIRDRNTIYGVIRGSGINQDGATSGITAPSGLSQTELETTVYERFKIDPGEITYIEAHGTGTKLGDPIEIRALTQAFRKYSDRKADCPIGSVKSNIGHLTTAAGIASVIKVLQALQHRRLPPAINLQNLNPMIDFEGSPFFVNREPLNWERKNGSGRLAAISSFGFSGTNCHMVIGDVVEDDGRPQGSDWPCYLVPLSAKSGAALRQRCRDLRAWISRESSTALLADLAFTLQYGRSHFEHRIALVVTDFADLVARLDAFLTDKSDAHCIMGPSEPTYSDNSRLSHEANRWIEEVNQSLAPDMAACRKALLRLAGYYTRGATIEWERLPFSHGPRLISLPLYPFARSRYWFPKPAVASSAAIPVSVSRLHPLVHQQVASTNRQKVFVTVLEADMDCLKDHRIDGRGVLPASATLEMARAAVTLSGLVTGPVSSISEVQWLRPIRVQQTPVEVRIELTQTDDNISFRITDADANEVFCSGLVVPPHQAVQHVPSIDVSEVVTATAHRASQEAWYQEFSNFGLRYGRSFQVLEWIRDNPTTALVRYKAASSKDEAGELIIPPGLLDGAFQSVFALMQWENGSRSKGLFWPFQLGSIEISGSLRDACFAVAESVLSDAKSHMKRFNISITNDKGTVLSRISDFVLKETPQNGKNGTHPSLHEFCFEPVWVPAEKPVLRPLNADARILIVDATSSLGNQLEPWLQGGWEHRPTPYTVEAGSRFERVAPRQFRMNYALESDYDGLLTEIRSDDRLPDVIIHLCNFGSASVNGNGAVRDLCTQSVFLLSKALVKQRLTQPVQLFFVDANPSPESAVWLSGVAGFANSMSIENPNLSYRTIEVDHEGAASQNEVLRNLATVLSVELDAE